MAKVLVVCYSRGGTTLRIARELERALGADFDEIREPLERPGPLGFVRAGFEAIAKGVPSIRTRKNPADYGLVVLGTPVWAGTMASPMRSYLMLHGQRLRNAAFFCTMAGHGGAETLSEMAALCSAEHPPRLALSQWDVKTGLYRARLRDYAARLGNTIQIEAMRAKHAPRAAYAG